MNIPRTIVIFGSSSAYGKNDIEAGGFAGRLRRWHEEIDVMNKTFNMGVPGATIDHLLERLESESAHRNPDLLVLMLGGNDAARQGTAENDCNTPIEDFKQKYADLLQRMQDIAPIVVVGNLPNDDTRTTPVSWRDVFFFREDMIEYAQEMKNITLRAGIDYVDIMGEWLKDDAYIDKYVSHDGLHANSVGHEYIFEKLRDRIMTKYGEQEAR